MGCPFDAHGSSEIASQICWFQNGASSRCRLSSHASSWRRGRPDLPVLMIRVCGDFDGRGTEAFSGGSSGDSTVLLLLPVLPRGFRIGRMKGLRFGDDLRARPWQLERREDRFPDSGELGFSIDRNGGSDRLPPFPHNATSMRRRDNTTSSSAETVVRRSRTGPANSVAFRIAQPGTRRRVLPRSRSST